METNISVTKFVSEFIIPNGRSYFIMDGKLQQGKALNMAEEILLAYKTFVHWDSYFSEYNEDYAIKCFETMGVIFKDQKGYYYTSSVINYDKLYKFIKDQSETFKRIKQTDNNQKLINQLSTLFEDKLTENRDRTVSASTESVSNILNRFAQSIKNINWEQNIKIASTMVDVMDTLVPYDQQKSEENKYSLPEEIRKIIREEISSLLDVQQKETNE